MKDTFVLFLLHVQNACGDTGHLGKKRDQNVITEHPAWGPRHYVLPVVQFTDVFSDVCASDAGMTLNVHVVSQSKNNLTDK